MALAERDDRIELISADSMQVYCGMDIGTAKPTPTERDRVRHHLIDIADPAEDYTVSRFVVDVQRALADTEARGKTAVLVGGTGLYVRAVIDELDIPGQFPEVRAELEAESDTAALHRRLDELDAVAASRMEPTNRRRVVRALEVTLGSGRPFSSFGPGLDRYPPVATRQIGCDRSRASIDDRIDRRYRQQMELGFLDEVRSLAARPGGLSRTARQALGYKELLLHIDDGDPLEECLELARRRTRRFARRQQRWFRRDPRIERHDLDTISIDELAAAIAGQIGGG